ncbi:MAG: hypothetical protein RLZZ344_97 [Pseudomonadota bacterium]|jgi:HemY protein
MKWFLAKLIVLAVLVAVILGLQSHGGAVTLWWGTWRFDVALSTAILAVGLLIIVLVSLIRIWGWLGRLPKRIRDYRQRSHESLRMKRLSDLTLDFLEGRYTRVTRAAEAFDKEFQDLDTAEHSVSRMVAVFASRAAHRLRDRPLRDQWLEKAAAGPRRQWRSDHQQLQALTQAEFLIDDQDGPAALRVLQDTLAGDRRHIHGTRLLLKAYELTGQWSEVIRLARLLENRKALHEAVVEKIKRSAYAGLLKSADADPSAIRHVVDKMSSAEREDPVLVSMAARAWVRAGRHREARQMIEAVLKTRWDVRLIEVYADCSDNPKEQFSRLEQWAQTHAESFELHWALGRLSQSQELWGKAQQHLNRASSIRPSVRVSHALAQIAQAQGKDDEARAHWQEAARLAETQRLAVEK